ncbi:hypothetical protein CWO85_02660 [Candidatus Phytoplasma ziziphi]|uniref:Uncharacterized protein n=1 Tax=Ziziphus jujuba witches'-broom phytoplasma TaxID=135727 RepID=A0A660HMW1_ZIZJU|nr:hypothetical protein CWO85_02660 [Candidatus Phytoplasma ziziphi]
METSKTIKIITYCITSLSLVLVSFYFIYARHNSKKINNLITNLNIQNTNLNIQNEYLKKILKTINKINKKIKIFY